MPLPEDKKQEILHGLKERLYIRKPEDDKILGLDFHGFKGWLSNTLDKVHDEAVEAERERMKGHLNALDVANEDPEYVKGFQDAVNLLSNHE